MNALKVGAMDVMSLSTNQRYNPDFGQLLASLRPRENKSREEVCIRGVKSEPLRLPGSRGIGIGNKKSRSVACSPMVGLAVYMTPADITKGTQVKDVHDRSLYLQIRNGPPEKHKCGMSGQPQRKSV